MRAVRTPAERRAGAARRRPTATSGRAALSRLRRPPFAALVVSGGRQAGAAGRLRADRRAGRPRAGPAARGSIGQPGLGGHARSTATAPASAWSSSAGGSTASTPSGSARRCDRRAARAAITAVAVAPDGAPGRAGRRRPLSSSRRWSTSGDGVQLLQPPHDPDRRCARHRGRLEQRELAGGGGRPRRTAAGWRSSDVVDRRRRRCRRGSTTSARRPVSYLTAYPASPEHGGQNSDSVAYVANGCRLRRADRPGPDRRPEIWPCRSPNPPAGVGPTAPFFLR